MVYFKKLDLILLKNCCKSIFIIIIIYVRHAFSLAVSFKCEEGKVLYLCAPVLQRMVNLAIYTETRKQQTWIT